MIKNPTILVIDDEEVMRDSCKQVISNEGYFVSLATNGKEGLQKVQDVNPDLALIDLKMPGMDGMELLEKIHRYDPKVIKIVITGYATIESAVEAMKLGAFDFLPKPFTPNELRIIVKRGLEHRRFILENERLQQEKRQMRQNFISMVSHELRSPLAAVQQNLMVITNGMVGEIPDKAQSMLLRMKERIKSLIQLITDWLDLSRIESGELVPEMEPVNLRKILLNVIDLLYPLAHINQIKIISQIPKNFHTILGNEDTLKMLFTNLIQNGVKYNRSGGEVQIILEEEDHRAKVSVKDTGIGIPKEKLPLIFEQFYRIRGDQPVEGSGLGLSIVKKIIEAHGGTINVDSRLGEGTTFIVYLP